MKIRLVVLTTVALSALPAVVGAASDAAPFPPPPPPMMTTTMPQAVSRLLVGPVDSLNFPRVIKGKLTITVATPPNVKPASAEILVDGKQIAKDDSRPFTADFDTSTVTDGDHIFKAICRDSGGKELWAASTKANIANSSGMTMGSRPPMNISPRVVKPAARKPGNKPNKADNSSGPLPVGLDLSRTYNNEQYKFFVKYPGKWTFRDQTVTMKPKSPSEFWLVFGEYPIEKSPLTVNIRHIALQPGTNADTFSKYNSYVRSWKSTTALGCPAYCTTSKVSAKRQIIHRMIVVMNGSALMMNCIDTTGKPAEENANLLAAMVNTIEFTD